MRGMFENIFQNGMTSDYDVVLQPEGTYSYMRNCQLVSQDGHNFVVKDCIGNLKTFTINPPYVTNYSTVGVLPRIIGMISFPDKLVVFSTNNEEDTTDNPSNTGYLEIGVINYLPYGEGIQPLAVTGQYNSGYTPLYHSAFLNASQKHRIKGFAFKENELVERVYWTDNYNEPRVFNISDPIFSTYIASGSIAFPNTYMVLEGAVTYSGINYGPGLPDGNIFVGAIGLPNYTNLTGTSPTPKVVIYYPYQLLNFTPNRTMSSVRFSNYSTGNLYCGNKIYFSRQVTEDGVYTSWSYGSSPVPVGTQNELDALGAVPYHNFVGAGDADNLVNSGLAVQLSLTDYDSNFPIIEIACAEFDNDAQTPRQITIIYRGSPSNTAIIHDGNTNLGDVTLSDLTLFPANILKCKTLATNKNYIIAGNITERPELDVSFTGATAEVLYYPMNTHYDAASCSLSSMIYSGVSPSVGNPAAGTVTPFSRWVVISGTAIYNGSNYTTGMVITGVTGAGNDSIDTTTNPGTVINACVTKNNYTTTGSARRENAIQLLGTAPSITAFWDFKSAAAHYHVAGYWGDETYRYAVVFYDLKGNPYYARHLIDYTFPMTGTEGIIRKDEIGNSGEYIYSLNNKLISFSNIVIPLDVAAQISGFSIMRAVRDAKIVTQGLVMQTNHTGASPDVYRASSIIPVAYDSGTVGDKTYVYLSPDLLCDAELPSTYGQIGDTMEVADAIDAFDYSAGAAASGKRRLRSLTATGLATYCKLVEPPSYTPSEQWPSPITYWADGSENTTFDLGDGETLGTSLIVGSNSSLVDRNTCSAAADFTLDTYEANTCKKSVFKVSSDFRYGNSLSDDAYSDPGPGGATLFTTRLLVNYTKTGFSNPYGGTGEDALASTVYISTGHYQPINATVISETTVGSDLVFNDVEIAGGDCFVCLADIGYGLWNSSFGVNKYALALTFPCECNSNYNLRRGRKTSNSTLYENASAFTNSIVYLGPSSEVRLEDYSFNKGYEAQGSNVVYPALPVNFVNANQFEVRLRWAGQKIIGELIDSFRTFYVDDLKDISANFGQIMDINVKKDTVLVWQLKAISTVPILERQQISTAAGDAVTIGTGGVIDRWDVKSSFFGTQHQWSICETEYGFSFFDMINKAFVIIDMDGGGIIEVSQVLGLKAFFGEAFLEVITNATVDQDILLNSPTFADTSDRPVVGIGIISVYDPKFKMTYMTFKYYGQSSSGTISKNFTIGYLHTATKKCFVGFYGWCPYFMHNHNGLVLSMNDPKNPVQYLGASLANKSFIAGETLWGDSDKTREYICILAVTLDSAAKYPEGASGATYWKLVNSVNQIQVLNQPTSISASTAPDYNYNMFDGKVVNNQIDIVVNPKIEKNVDFEIQTLIQNTPTNVNYTDVYLITPDYTASDVNITSTNRFYRFIRDKITSSAPLTSKGLRITNKAIVVRLFKTNWSTDPTVLAKGVKILRSLTSIFNTKS